MARRKPSAVHHVVALIKVPMTLITLGGIWLASMLGKSRQAMAFLGRGMQSKRLKTNAFKAYQPTAHDVFVCTYSKSGTNWAMQIAYQITQYGQGTFDHIHDVVPWPETPMSTIVDLRDESAAQQAPTGLRVIKTHLESPYVPYSPLAKYIVVVRDPKEIFVSSYYFSSGMLARSAMLTVEEWLGLFLSADFPYGSWAEHMASYWPWRDRANVLLLTYDALKADTAGAARRIAVLMGVELSEAQLAAVLEKSSFAYMKRIDEKFMPAVPFPFNHLLGQPVMIRKGERGKSSELLTHEQQAQIDTYMRAGLARYHCDFSYDEMFATADATQLVA
jgi:Sulfotransferase domain